MAIDVSAIHFWVRQKRFTAAIPAPAATTAKAPGRRLLTESATERFARVFYLVFFSRHAWVWQSDWPELLQGERGGCVGVLCLHVR